MITTNVRTLSAIVRQRRKALHWSQDKLAAAAGVSRPWVSEFEAGKASVELGLVFSVLDALGLRMNVTSSTDSGKPDVPSKVARAGARLGAKASAPAAKMAPITLSGSAPAATLKTERPGITSGGKSIASARARNARASRAAPASATKKK